MAAYRQGWARGWRKSLRGNQGEWFDSSWELQYMHELDDDPLTAKWTRHHGLRIPYTKWWGGRGYYEPDFLVELVDTTKELREVKGTHLFADKNTTLKLREGERFCRTRGMTFRVVTKSDVDPDSWSLTAQVPAQIVPSATRPALAEDAYQPKTGGCLGMVAAVIALILATELFLDFFFVS